MLKFLLALALLAVATWAQLQPCPPDCATGACDGSGQCTACLAGFRLANGRCSLFVCDNAHAHEGIKNDGTGTYIFDARSGSFNIISADSSTHTFEIDVFAPPRYECSKTGHELTDAIDWETWLDEPNQGSPCSGADECGPSATNWTEVFYLGRETDDADGHLVLPIGGPTKCSSHYRSVAPGNEIPIEAANHGNNNLVQSWDPITSRAVLKVNLMDLSDTNQAGACAPTADYGATDRFKYWQKSINYEGDITTWQFDLTICYVDSTGDQSTCPFSSPVFKAQIDSVTRGVSVQSAGAVNLFRLPVCELYLRSAQVRYSGAITSRTAQGDYEIAVTCEGDLYAPTILDVHHCHIQAAGPTVDPQDPANKQTSTAQWFSDSFSASLTSYLASCPGDATLDRGKFVVDYELNADQCGVGANDPCFDITDTRLFGAAPLEVTDELREQTSFTESHEIYAGLFTSNDLRVDSAATVNDFHQYNRGILQTQTINRLAAPDQRNSVVMCALMQKKGQTVGDPATEVEHKFKISIREADFDVTYDSGVNYQTTLRDLVNANPRWPSRWVWEHPGDSAVRRQILKRESRVSGHVPTCDDDTVPCEQSPMQTHLQTHTANWDHIKENLDCVSILPFYLYSLLSMGPNLGRVPVTVDVNLTVFHEYLGSTDAAATRRLLNVGGRQLLQAEPQQVLGSALAENVGTGGMSFPVAEAESDKETTAEEDSGFPLTPVMIGIIAAASSCCFLIAGVVFWRRRHRTCAQCHEYKKLSEYSKEQLKMGEKAQCKDCVNKGALTWSNIATAPQLTFTNTPPAGDVVVPVV